MRLPKYLFILLFVPPVAMANLVVVANAPVQIRLRVGATAATITTTTVTVAGGNVGNSAVQLMTANAAARSGSSCAANHVFFNAEARAAPAGSRTATLTANSTAGITCTTAATCGADNIPFTEVDWINTTPAAYAPVTIAAGAFSGGGAQVILVFNNSNQSQDCLRFRYLNQNVVRAGTYSGDVIYTLSMP
ncbi:MAG: hypothetical protein ABI790_14415 [Betaproteobacteria bacterium]